MHNLVLAHVKIKLPARIASFGVRMEPARQRQPQVNEATECTNRVLARNLIQSLSLLSSAMRVFAEKCVDGIQANRAGTDASAGATLAVATALNGAIGYDKGTVIVKKATASGRPLREVALEEGVDAKLYDETIDLRRIARGNQA